MKKKLMITCISVILCAAIAVSIGSSGGRLSVEEVSVSVASDYPIFMDIESMSKAADFIVVGQYKEFLSTWNVDRNPANPLEEDPTSYSEGRLYAFNVDEIIKGNVENEITIGKYFSAGAQYFTGKVDGVNQYVDYQMPTQYFVEPEYGEKYLLFLSYDEASGSYYAVGEPYEILIREDGTAELKSNIFNPAEDLPRTLYTEATTDDTIYKISVGGLDIGRYDDFISGLKLEEITEKIEK